MATVSCVYIKQVNPQDYIWRRLQVSDSQAERQKKSVIQMCITFHSRAEAIQNQDCRNLVVVNTQLFHARRI